LMTNRKR